VLGEFTRKNKSDGCLDFSRRDCRLLRVGGELRCFRSNAFKDIVDETVEDGHRLVGDTSIGVDLLEDLVDVRGISLLSDLLALLLFALTTCRRLRSLLRCLGTFSGFGGGLGSGRSWGLAGS